MEGFLDKEVQQDHLRLLAGKNVLSLDELEQAARISGIIPDRKAWSGFLNKLFLLLGSLLMVAGVIFFFAYNWASMHRLLKFGLVHIALVIAVFTASYLGLTKLSGKVTLLVSSILIGALLALFGQIYQTGADAYQLFFGWAALITGWVLVGNFAPLWLLLLVLMELTVSLYWSQVVVSSWVVYRSPVLYEILFGMNAVALAVWESFSFQGISWLKGRWIPRVMSSAALFFLVVPFVILIIGGFSQDNGYAALLPFLYLGSTGFVLWYYRFVIFDLYMIAATLLSLIVIVTVLFAKAIGNNFGGYLLLSILIIGLSGGAAAWLRNLARARQQEEAS